MSRFKFTEPILIKAGNERLRLGVKQEFPMFDCRVIWEEGYQHLIQMKKQRDEMLEILEKISAFIDANENINYKIRLLSNEVPNIKQLIKEATEL